MARPRVFGALQGQAPFSASSLFTTSGRVLGTQYTNGKSRRQVVACVRVSNGATVTVQTTVGGVSRSFTATDLTASATSTLGGALTVNETQTIPVPFPVDPSGTYTVSATGTATVVSWLEVDG